MILVALGANLPSVAYGPPRETLEAVLRLLGASGLQVLARSHWYASAPVPPADQPPYVNGVVSLGTSLPAGELLSRLHAIEADVGRVRGLANAARPVDLDLLDYDGQISPAAAWPQLPHPRLHQRAFVLLPLADVAPGWRHPVTGQNLAEMMVALPADQTCCRLA